MSWLLARFLHRPETLDVEYDSVRHVIRLAGTIYTLEWRDWAAFAEWYQIDPCQPPIRIHVV